MARKPNETMAKARDEIFEMLESGKTSHDVYVAMKKKYKMARNTAYWYIKEFSTKKSEIQKDSELESLRKTNARQKEVLDKIAKEVE